LARVTSGPFSGESLPYTIGVEHVASQLGAQVAGAERLMQREGAMEQVYADGWLLVWVNGAVDHAEPRDVEPLRR
jgi:hypothetical protein